MFMLVAEFGDHMTKHGDGAKDVAFGVLDCRAIYKVILIFVFDFLHELTSVYSVPSTVAQRAFASLGRRQTKRAQSYMPWSRRYAARA